MKPWRLIISPPLDGVTNMAIDTALFRLGGPPTLRFYSWSRPTLSLGYFQRPHAQLLKRCLHHGIDVVRRPTGGRAVLHGSEITYSVICAYDEFPGSSSLQSIYNTLAGWHLASFSAVGIAASLSGGEGRAGRHYASKAVCFLTSIPCEVVVKGRKICGSAQKRGSQGFLQHGSIPFDPDLEEFLAITGEEAKALKGFTTLRKEGYDGSREHFIHIMCEAFETVLDCRLQPRPLSGDEMEKIVQCRKSTVTCPS